MLGKAEIRKTKHSRVVSHILMKPLQILFQVSQRPDINNGNVLPLCTRLFNAVPMSESNGLEKTKSNCCTSAISMVKRLNMHELWWDSEDCFAAVAITDLGSPVDTTGAAASDGRGEG